MNRSIYPFRTIVSFLLVLFTMPLGHALMILMEHGLSDTALHYCAFIMGAMGFLLAVAGVFVKGDTRQTLFGLFGSLLFWTGWVEFLFAYYAQRYGVHCDLVGDGIVQTATRYVNGVGVGHETFINNVPLEEYSRSALKAMRGSRPEYLIMPSSFGFFMMFALIYIFSVRTGCSAINWCQRMLFRGKRDIIVARPMTRHVSIVTFVELTTMMWASYLLLMFCYDPVFLGDSHPVTLLLAALCGIGSIFMFKRELRLKGWGANIRMAIATVIVFWTAVEVVARNRFISEMWLDPMGHIAEMSVLLVAFLLLLVYLFLRVVKQGK